MKFTKAQTIGWLLVSSLGIFSLGCESVLNSTKPAPSSGARFTLVNSDAFGVALDTKTGQLCHTYNQHIDTFVAETGDFHPTGSAPHPSLDSIPLCIDLSQNENMTVKQIIEANQKDRLDQEKMQQQIDQMRKQLDDLKSRR